MHRWASVGIAFLALSLASCGGFHEIGVPDGGDAGNAGPVPDLAFPPGTDLAGIDLSTSNNLPDLSQSNGPTGPGPYGALPSGYCCNAATDCRERSCIDFGGGKMCSDGCGDDSSCNSLPGLQCVGATQLDPGACQPKVKTMACVPSSNYKLGSKKLGACCNPTFDGMSGAECEGGRCDSSGDINNPYICTNACESQNECPGPFTCTNIGPFSVCIPVTDPYTCN
jgi:hypothetical protein